MSRWRHHWEGGFFKTESHQPPQIQLQSHCWQVTDCKAQPLPLSSLSTVITSLSVPETPTAGRHLPLEICSNTEIIIGLHQVGERHRHTANILPAGTVSAKDFSTDASNKGEQSDMPGQVKNLGNMGCREPLSLWVRNPCSTSPSHLNPTIQVPPCAPWRETSKDGLCSSIW